MTGPFDDDDGKVMTVPTMDADATVTGTWLFEHMTRIRRLRRLLSGFINVA